MNARRFAGRFVVSAVSLAMLLGVSASPVAARVRASEVGNGVHHHAHGRITVTVHGEVVSSRLPHCRNEDGSGQRSACTWNVGPKVDGNGVGLSYWLDRHDRTHYVWPTPNVPAGWQHITRTWARNLSEGGHRPRYWLKCRVRFGQSTTTVACPNGFRYMDAS